MTRHSKLAFSVAGAFAVAMCGYFVSHAPARRALPWSASDIREHRVDMFVDYAYYLRARMPHQDFVAYVQRLRLRPQTHEDVAISWTKRGLPSWWTATASRDRVHWKQRGDHFVAAKHEDGYVFVQAWSH